MPIVWPQKKELRSAWNNEARDFTPWLAEAENLSKLGEILGLNQLELIRIEHPVGNFSVDIFCTDDEGEVIIENQLELSDHTHLGQIITYAAGVKAKKVIWIAKEIRREHAAAIEFLNESTNEDLSFFAVEINVSEANGNFMPAFEVIVRPNDWARENRETARASIMYSPTSQLQLKYWTALINYLDENDIDLRRPRIQARGWVPISIGRTGFLICLKVNSVSNTISVELYIDHNDSKIMFEKLRQDQSLIDQETGLILDWQELPNRHACRIEYTKTNCDLTEETNWENFIKWHVDIAAKFYKSFEKRVLELD